MLNQTPQKAVPWFHSVCIGHWVELFGGSLMLNPPTGLSLVNRNMSTHDFYFYFWALCIVPFSQICIKCVFHPLAFINIYLWHQIDIQRFKLIDCSEILNQIVVNSFNKKVSLLTLLTTEIGVCQLSDIVA